MSSKSTKELNETHLAALTQTFGRSSSTSTIKGGDSNGGGDETRVASQAHSIASTLSSNGIAASEALVSPPVVPVRLGILIVTLHEGRGLALSPQSSHPHSAHGQASSFVQSDRPQSISGGINAAPTIHGRYSTKYLPYALLEFEKNQIFVDAVSGTPENPLWASTAVKFDVSRKTELNVQLYLRNPAARQDVGARHNPVARQDVGWSGDIFLGAVKVHPRFEEGAQPYVEDPKLSKKDNQKAATAHAEQERTMGQRTEWLDLQFGNGSIKIGVLFAQNRQSLRLEDFDLLKVVSRGSSGMVIQAMKKDTRQIYAIKTIRKAQSEVTHTIVEQSVLAQINNPFIVPLKFSFQSPLKLYLVLPFIKGGKLFHHLQREQRFDINRARFYTAELLCALECLHRFKVIYRDLKPENILLDCTGHIALCDFSLCKLDTKNDDQLNTLCGTPKYLAPELLLGNRYTETVDWWMLGVLLYEMLTGLPPFYDENADKMYHKILQEPLTFPSSDIVPPPAQDLLTHLLDRDPLRRLGTNGAAEIKSHQFFANIDWCKLLQRKYEPSFRLNMVDVCDTDNFNIELTNKAPQDSYDGPCDFPALSSTAQQQFARWSYSRPVAGLGDAGGSVEDPSFGSIPE
ncbi:hypothetical protein CDV55_106995 [Aspergillus turcosus]|nr:hypothetical protein CDV55_106995 [Aspergillus turcosus]